MCFPGRLWSLHDRFVGWECLLWERGTQTRPCISYDLRHGYIKLIPGHYLLKHDGS